MTHFPLIVVSDQPQNVETCNACDQFHVLPCGRAACKQFNVPERFYNAVLTSSCPLGKHMQEGSTGSV